MDINVAEEDIKSQDFELNAETELRCTVEDNGQVILEMHRGTAEILGAELVLHRKYVFKNGSKISVFTWHGCKLVLRGQFASSEIARQTPMVIYASIHAAIEQMRQIAEEKFRRGPSVLVAGPSDVGKSSLCKLLLNYAVRQGRKPIFIDLDVGQGEISIPGTICAARLENQTSIEDSFINQSQLVYPFGFKSPGHDITLYNKIISHIAGNMSNRAKQDVSASANGIIINTCGWVKSDGYRAVTQAALAFEVDVILVLGMESLYRQMSRDVPNFVKVVFIPRFNNTVERSRPRRIELRGNRIAEYFYGNSTSLKPYSYSVKYHTLRIYKVERYENQATRNAQGLQVLNNGFCMVPVPFGYNLLNHILCVTFSSEIEENVMFMSVAGFVCISRIDTSSKELTLISPQAPPLPDVILLFSDITFDRELS